MAAVHRVHDGPGREYIADARDRGDTGVLEIRALGEERSIELVPRRPDPYDDQRPASKARFGAAVHIRDRI